MSIQTYAARRRAEAPARQTRASAGPGLSMDALRAGAAARETSGGRADLPGAIQARMDHAFGPGLSAGQLHTEQAGGEQAYSGPVAGSLSSASAVSAAGPMQASKKERKLQQQVTDLQGMALSRYHLQGHGGRSDSDAPGLSPEENARYESTLQNASPELINELMRQQTAAAQSTIEASQAQDSDAMLKASTDYQGFRHVFEEMAILSTGAKVRNVVLPARNAYVQDHPDDAQQWMQAENAITADARAFDRLPKSAQEQRKALDISKVRDYAQSRDQERRERERRGFWGNLFHK